MKYRLKFIVAKLWIPMAKKYHPVGHKLYKTFHNYVALAHESMK